MRDQLRAYPGKVLQYPRAVEPLQLDTCLPHIYSPASLLDPTASPLIQPSTPSSVLEIGNLYAPFYPPVSGWRPAAWNRRASLRASLDDVSLSKSGKEKRRPKLSLKIVRKLSRLLSPGKDEDGLHVEYDPVGVHNTPKRSRSLEGEGRRFSRRQMLASLEEEENVKRMGELILYSGVHTPRFYSVGGLDELVEDWEDTLDSRSSHTNHIYNSTIQSSFNTSSYPRVDLEGLYSEESKECSSTENSSEAGSTAGERFSRCNLIQSISREETGSQSPDLEDEQTCSGHSKTSACHNSQNSEKTDRESLRSSEAGSDCDDVNDNIAEAKAADNKWNSSEAGSGSDDQLDNCESASDAESVDDNSNCDNENRVNDNEAGSGVLIGRSPPADLVSALRLDDLRWVGTLGVGGFGRVELVTAGRNNNHAFALKKMKKVEITDTKQQLHIITEKQIMISCSNPFIVQLYKTFKDTRYLYMLMEPCLGGELWTLLRNKKRFDDNSSRFYTACVIKAFEYLHEKGIVYRDLKPENLLLDSTGYVKLTDFGFSKQLAPGEKSWTFCGTPEYVAPEIITNKSHDLKADMWSVGILMYELLNGVPPFSKTNTSQQVYNDILKGMKAVNFPSYMSATAVELIRQLCRLSPSQRPSLSVTKRYMWFAGMDWKGLEARTLTPPHLPTITGVNDISNFDNYVKESEEPAEDHSDWDAEF